MSNAIVPVAPEHQNNPEAQNKIRESVSTATFVLLDQQGAPLMGFTKGQMDTVESQMGIMDALLGEKVSAPELLAANFAGKASVGTPSSGMLLAAEDAIAIRNWLRGQSVPVEVIVATMVIVPPKELLAEWLESWFNAGGDEPADNEETVFSYMADQMLNYLKGART